MANKPREMDANFNYDGIKGVYDDISGKNYSITDAQQENKPDAQSKKTINVKFIRSKDGHTFFSDDDNVMISNSTPGHALTTLYRVYVKTGRHSEDELGEIVDYEVVPFKWFKSINDAINYVKNTFYSTGAFNAQAAVRESLREDILEPLQNKAYTPDWALVNTWLLDNNFNAQVESNVDMLKSCARGFNFENCSEEQARYMIFMAMEYFAQGIEENWKKASAENQALNSPLDLTF